MRYFLPQGEDEDDFQNEEKFEEEDEEEDEPEPKPYHRKTMRNRIKRYSENMHILHLGMPLEDGRYVEFECQTDSLEKAKELFYEMMGFTGATKVGFASNKKVKIAPTKYTG